jgi:hypothetical protein
MPVATGHRSVLMGVVSEITRLPPIVTWQVVADRIGKCMTVTLNIGNP